MDLKVFTFVCFNKWQQSCQERKFIFFNNFCGKLFFCDYFQSTISVIAERFGVSFVFKINLVKLKIEKASMR